MDSTKKHYWQEFIAASANKCGLDLTDAQIARLTEITKDLQNPKTRSRKMNLTELKIKRSRALQRYRDACDAFNYAYKTAGIDSLIFRREIENGRAILKKCSEEYYILDNAVKSYIKKKELRLCK